MRIFTLIFVLLALVVVFAEKPIVAVYGLDSDSFSETEVKAFNTMIESALFDTGYFKIVERAKLKELIKERKLEDLGIAQREKEIIQLAITVGADYVIFGTIEMVKSDTVLNIKIVDVKTSEVVFSDTQRIPGNDLMKIENAIKAIIAKIKVDKEGRIQKAKLSGPLFEFKKEDKKEVPPEEDKTWVNLGIVYLWTMESYSVYDSYTYYEETTYEPYLPFIRVGSIHFKKGSPDYAAGLNLFLGISYRKYFGPFYGEVGTLMLFVPYILAGLELGIFNVEALYLAFPVVSLNFAF